MCISDTISHFPIESPKIKLDQPHCVNSIKWNRDRDNDINNEGVCKSMSPRKTRHLIKGRLSATPVWLICQYPVSISSRSCSEVYSTLPESRFATKDDDRRPFKWMYLDASRYLETSNNYKNVQPILTSFVNHKPPLWFRPQ